MAWEELRDNLCLWHMASCHLDLQLVRENLSITFYYRIGPCSGMHNIHRLIPD